MSTLALWVGWAVLVVGGVLAAVTLLTFIPYLILNQCWKYLKAQKDFIQIAVRYFGEKKSKERSIMGTPE